jgi:hypothetical protein
MLICSVIMLFSKQRTDATLGTSNYYIEKLSLETIKPAAPARKGHEPQAVAFQWQREEKGSPS